MNELRLPARLAKHAFYPFVRADKKVRRFTRKISFDESGQMTKCIEIKQKLRPIMYASHRDAIIFGFYGYMLKRRYEVKARQLGISETVIAYRKIQRNDGSNRNKSNIDFANDIYKVLGKYEKSAIICLDITNFFGTMVHKNIEKTWQQLLDVDSLPIGHKTVFKHITRYRYLFLNDAKVALGLGKIVRGRFEYKKSLLQSKRTGPLSSSPGIYNKLITKKKIIKNNGSPCGIPQGSPISDILANMYLMDFDTKINILVNSFEFGISRRYSDDILIICPQDKVIGVYNEVEQLLTSFGLVMNKNKSELFFLDRVSGQLVDQTGLLVEGYAKNKSSIQYLGFEFDLDDIHIRSGTISNYYRKIVRSIKKDEAKQEKKTENEHSTIKIKKNKRDKYAYIKKASLRINGLRLAKQFSNVRKRTSRLRRKSKSRHYL